MAPKKPRSEPPRNAEVNVGAPQFQEDLRKLTDEDRRAALDTIRQILAMSWSTIYKHRGLHWEQIHSVDPPAILKIDKWFSIRLTKGRRARVYRDGNVMKFIDIPPDHDSTYH